MIVIHLARKPLAGTVAQNVIQWGTGGLNIDRTRIGAAGGTSRSGQAEYPKKEDGTEDRSGSWARTGHEIVSLPLGRWPANLILEHLSGCRMMGIQQAKSYVINRWDDGAKPFGGGAGHDFTGHEIQDTVEVWDCTPGCPALDLNDQSGDRPGLSGGGAIDNRKTGRETIPSFNRKPSAPFIRGDSGGASRFFKNVQEEPDFIRASGDVMCDQCGHEYRDHPHDMRMLDWDGHPYLRVTCDGRRLKL